MNVEQITEAALLNLTKKALTNNTSHALNNMFTINYKRLPRGLNTITISHKGQLGRKNTNFSAKAVHSFNRLPPELRDPQLTCIGSKKGLKQ